MRDSKPKNTLRGVELVLIGLVLLLYWAVFFAFPLEVVPGAFFRAAPTQEAWGQLVARQQTQAEQVMMALVPVASIALCVALAVLLVLRLSARHTKGECLAAVVGALALVLLYAYDRWLAPRYLLYMLLNAPFVASLVLAVLIFMESR